MMMITNWLQLRAIMVKVEASRCLFLLFLLFPHVLLPALSQEYRSPHADSLLYFEMKPVDLAASGSYSLLLRDLDKDGRNDLVLMAYAGTTSGETPGEVYWYHFDGVDSHNTPLWTKRLIAKKKHVVHSSFIDVNQDGYDDIVFNSDFEVPPEDVAPQGDFWCALNPGPAKYDDGEWDLVHIGRVVGNHRTAAADFDGDGHAEAVAVPLFSPGDEPYYGPASIVLFEPPRPWNKDEAWKSYNLSIGKFINPHDVLVAPSKNDDGHSLILASHDGLHLLNVSKTGDEYEIVTTQMHDYPVDNPLDENARDVGVKPLTQSCEPNPDDLHGVTALTKNVADAATLPYLATIDYTNTTGILPGQVWHGDQVSIYFPAEGATVLDPGLNRVVLEKRYSGGHTVAVYDFDQDGCADVVAGFREYPTSLVLYRCVKDATNAMGVSFRKQIISERGTNDIVIDDFDGDGMKDMATVGFGGMSGEGGDPYVLLWLYRDISTVSKDDSDSDSSDDSSKYPDGVVIALIALSCLLINVVIVLGIRVSALKKQINDSRHASDKDVDMRQSLLSSVSNP